MLNNSGFKWILIFIGIPMIVFGIIMRSPGEVYEGTFIGETETSSSELTYQPKSSTKVTVENYEISMSVT